MDTRNDGKFLERDPKPPKTLEGIPYASQGASGHQEASKEEVEACCDAVSLRRRALCSCAES